MAIITKDTDDEEMILAEMDMLAKDAGDWRTHLPYEAALHFNEQTRIREAYQSHVDNCEYCQRLIETLQSG